MSSTKLRKAGLDACWTTDVQLVGIFHHGAYESLKYVFET